MKWPEFNLSKLTRQFISGGTPSTKKQEYWSGDIPWITGADFFDGEVVIGRRYINKNAVNNSATHIVPVGSILMVTRTSVGKIAIAPVDIAISQDITGIVPRQVVNSKFLVSAIRQRMDIILAAQRGATIKGVTRGDIKQLSIPLPPLSEQRRIVEILDQADALRKKRFEADTKAARILPALFFKMFGDPATNPKGWNSGKFGDVIETQYGTSTKANTNGDGLPVLRMNNIDSDGHLDIADLKYVVLSKKEQERYALIEGDILFNRTNSKELVGKTGLWQGDIEAVPASYLIRMRVDREQILPEFIWAYMNCPFIKQMLLNKARRAIGMANINAKELRSLPLILPAKEHQKAFVKKLDSVEQLRAQRKKNGEAINRLFATLLHRAFTGDLTAKWREVHMKKILAEMERQEKLLALESIGRRVVSGKV